MSVAMMLLEAVVLASSLSLDAFVASFAYGVKKIRIPFSSALVIDFTCGGILGLSLLLGTWLRPWLSPKVSSALCFSLLFFIGLAKLLDNITKSILRKQGGLSKNIRFSLSSFQFVLSVYADPEQADVDSSKSISLSEAFSLAAALSLDGLAVGFGAALGQVSGWAVFFCALITDAIAVRLGVRLGHKLACALRFNLSWLSGAVLILLAFLKLL